MFEDATVEREVDIRKRILKDFNKKEDDFATLKEYNDYLEEVETIIFNLTYNIDILNTNKKIDQFKKENRETILRNKAKLSREEMELEMLLEQEKQQEEFRKKLIVKEEMEKKKKIKSKEDMIDQLMAEEGDAKNIVETYANILQKESEESKSEIHVPVKQFSTGIKFGHGSQQSCVFLPKVEEGPLFSYSAPEIVINGPLPPEWDQVERKGFISNVRETSVEESAGGYKSTLACMRALQEAFAGLYHIPETRSELIEEIEEDTEMR